MINSALNNWREGKPSLGIWVNLPYIHLTEIAARSGVDWLCFDLQHGLMDYNDLNSLLPAICGQPVTPLVRVAANTPDQIGKALDVGAEGVIVPMVNSAEEAQRAVSACFYPPQGLRSCGPMRPVMVAGPEYLAKANEQIACVPMIETEEGLKNVEAIAAVEGVDGLFIGPMDLCYGLGLQPGDFSNSRFVDAVAVIVAACRKHRRVVGMFGYSPEMARDSLASGFDFASAATDISFFRAGLAQGLATARGEVQQAARQKAGY
jgi:4-hydroxy-2-oxoheptanedioate aldolase